jgi:hypothetical protein
MRKKQHFGLIFLLVIIVISGGLIFAGFVQTAVYPYIKINNGSGMTRVRKVQLYLSGPEWAKQMKISNQADLGDADWEDFKSSKVWYLSYGGGIKTVYAKFKSATNKVSPLYRKDIRLNVPEDNSISFEINDGADTTNSRYVRIDVDYTKGVEGYIISNKNNFSELEFKTISKSVSWVLDSGEGKKKVYMQFLDSNGDKKTVTREIYYDEPDTYLKEGSLLKGLGSTIYYLGYDGRLHPFLSSFIYHSWYKNFSDVRYVGNSKLKQYHIGQPVCVRPGTWLLKFRGLPKIYAVEPGCRLKPILSEAEAFLIYGDGWNQRVLELDTVHMSNYNVLTYSVNDEDLDIEDRDRDGISREIEDDYETSDKKSDTDYDGLTDFEEINYWFTDPTQRDTDGDDYDDMTEILSGYPAAGYGNLNTLLENTYDYPKGSVIKKYTDGKLYYRHSDGKYYYLGRDVASSNFKNNRLDKKFIITSPFKLNFTSRSGWRVSSKEMEIYYPTQLIADEVSKL